MEEYIQYAMEFELIYKELVNRFDIEKSVKEICEMRCYFDRRIMSTLMSMGVVYIDYFDIKDYSFTYDDLKKFNMFDKNGSFILEKSYIIPIRDMEGYLIGIVGWVPGQNTARKYRTVSPNYFNKSTSLFNIDNAVEIGEFKKVALVEGIFDAIAMRSIGIPCVSIQGSKVSQVHRELLKLFAKVLCIPDNDSEGKKELLNWGIEGNVTTVELLGTIQIGEEIRIIKDCDDAIKYFENMEDIFNEYFTISQKYVKLQL